MFFFFPANVGACFPKQGNHTSHSHISSCRPASGQSGWPVILFLWFCQLYVKVLSPHTAQPQRMGVVCVPCALAAVPGRLYERERGGKNEKLQREVKLNVHQVVPLPLGGSLGMYVCCSVRRIMHIQTEGARKPRCQVLAGYHGLAGRCWNYTV